MDTRKVTPQLLYIGNPIQIMRATVDIAGNLHVDFHMSHDTLTYMCIYIYATWPYYPAAHAAHLLNKVLLRDHLHEQAQWKRNLV